MSFLGELHVSRYSLFPLAFMEKKWEHTIILPCYTFTSMSDLICLLCGGFMYSYTRLLSISTIMGINNSVALTMLFCQITPKNMNDLKFHVKTLLACNRHKKYR